MENLETAIRMARDEGHLDPRVDPAQLAFELNALFFGANFAWQLRRDGRGLERAETAIVERLESLRVTRPRGKRAHPRRARA